VLAFHGQHAFALGTAIVFARALPPSQVQDFPACSWQEVAFSAGGDGGKEPPDIVLHEWRMISRHRGGRSDIRSWLAYLPSRPF